MLLGGQNVSPKERLILDMLCDARELYGTEFIDRSEGQLVRGTLYVMLHKLTKKGLVSARNVEKPEGAIGPQRRYYRITAEGRRVAKRIAELEALRGKAVAR